MTMGESRHVSEGTVLADKLRVVRVLGTGAMGVVYEVEHTLTRHRRAVKVLNAEMLSRAPVVTRFLREASAAGHIGNRHIVETFDAGRLAGGEPYIVMELLHGETLADRLERDKRLPLADLVDIVGQACDGVQAAHDAGIVHRDLKPENIFLLVTGGPPFVKILDFGVSKFARALTDGNLVTREGAALGTPYYMSPEQVTGAPGIDGRADVYALGVILYECAAGERPFEAAAFPLLCARIHDGRPKNLGELRPDLPTGFVAVVQRAMTKERDQRFATARELGAALAGFGAISHLGTKAGLSSAPPLGSAVSGDRTMALPGRSPSATRWAVVVAAAVLLAAGLLALGMGAALRAPAVPVAKDPAAAPPADDREPVETLSPESYSIAPPIAVPRPSSSADKPQPARPPLGKSHVDQTGLARDNPYGR
jgi:serine/threonine protein kinase